MCQCLVEVIWVVSLRYLLLSVSKHWLLPPSLWPCSFSSAPSSVNSGSGQADAQDTYLGAIWLPSLPHPSLFQVSGNLSSGLNLSRWPASFVHKFYWNSVTLISLYVVCVYFLTGTAGLVVVTGTIWLASLNFASLALYRKICQLLI